MLLLFVVEEEIVVVVMVFIGVIGLWVSFCLSFFGDVWVWVIVLLINCFSLCFVFLGGGMMLMRWMVLGGFGFLYVFEVVKVGWGKILCVNEDKSFNWMWSWWSW